MDKRYQVFISSTFRDLLDERQAALRAVLELDQMPAGMELFPAADESAWQLIKDVIDASDYYVLIIGGRYGSLDEEGLGYTEKEYEYAFASRKPAIPLLHENPDNIPRGKTETDKASWGKLQAFRARVEQRHTCVYWNSAEELKARLIVGLTSAMKRHPAVGWMRADQVPSGATLKDVLALKLRVEELESELGAQHSGPPPGTEDLKQGDDSFTVSFGFSTASSAGYFSPFDDSRPRFTATIEPSWNEIFAAISPRLIGETSDSELRKALRTFFGQRAAEELKKDKALARKKISPFSFNEQDMHTCIVQMRALGLMEESRKKRGIHDTNTYWTLTPYGDAVMVRLLALTRNPPPPRKSGAKASESGKPESI